MNRKQKERCPVSRRELWRALSAAQRAELAALAREAETPAERRGALRCFMRYAGAYRERGGLVTL